MDPFGGQITGAPRADSERHDGAVADELRVGYGYAAAFGFPVRITYPLGVMTVREGAVELRPPRLLPIIRRVIVHAE
jgi:hypothetical protein